MRTLLTGAQGFVGRHVLIMAGELEQRHGAKLVLPSPDLDLRDRANIDACLGPLDFEVVLHLAGQSTVPLGFSQPEATFDVNVSGTVRLLSHLQARDFRGRFLFVSTGDVYGIVGPEQLPVTELTVPVPANPYAASKLAAEIAVLTWARWCPFDGLVARAFNHVGSGQSSQFSVARFAARVAGFAAGSEHATFATGRLDVSRDFLDVRDVVNAYFCLLRDGRAGEIYNVCSGVERTLRDVLNTLIELAGVSMKTTIDLSLIRPMDMQRMVGSAHKLMTDTGWRPRVDFRNTLADVLASCTSDLGTS